MNIEYKEYMKVEKLDYERILEGLRLLWIDSDGIKNEQDAIKKLGKSLKVEFNKVNNIEKEG